MCGRAAVCQEDNAQRRTICAANVDVDLVEVGRLKAHQVEHLDTKHLSCCAFRMCPGAEQSGNDARMALQMLRLRCCSALGIWVWEQVTCSAYAQAGWPRAHSLSCA